MAKLEGDSADSDTQLTKLDVVLTFQLEVSHNKIPQNIWRSYNHYDSPKLLNVLNTFLLMKVLHILNLMLHCFGSLQYLTGVFF
jgi:hypothetical protein